MIPLKDVSWSLGGLVVVVVVLRNLCVCVGILVRSGSLLFSIFIFLKVKEPRFHLLYIPRDDIAGSQCASWSCHELRY